MTGPIPGLPSGTEIRSHTELSGDFSLNQRYQRDRGTVLLSGVHALVRALMTRAQLDAGRGLSSGGFVSGYRGSPLGGLDKELWSNEKTLNGLGIQFQPGVNEDLAATAVWGTQQVGLHAGATVDGAFGMWYGKAPGLDRSCDAIRHANMWGTSPRGGVLLVVGDDPAAKSSSLASQSEFTLQDMMVPILSPSDVQDVLDFSVLGWEMSRHSGLWVGLKAIADHMDSTSTIEVGLERYPTVDLESVADVHIRREDTPSHQEERILARKIPAALDFARATNINRWDTKDLLGTRPARLGIVAAGKAYADIKEAFALMGATSLQEIRRMGVELLKLGMTWPIDETLVGEFAQRCQMLLVVEEKRAFVEPQIKEALYSNTGERPVPVLGKRNAGGEPLIPSTGLLDVDQLVTVLSQLLGRTVPSTLRASGEGRHAAAQANAPARSERTPLFCAGCPHNTSTRVPEGSRATAGIGCHYMVQWMDRDTDSCTQMGGEGVTWVGEAPFTNEQHLFANLGDGTYFHSGILAIRQAVAAGINITYKILFNDAVAMTGGQPTDGELDMQRLVLQVQAEGVEKVVIVSDEPAAFDRQFPGVAVFDRSKLDEVQRSLREVSGVSVLIYQQTCATELRRRRKRGLVEDNRPRLMINEAVCEGCGDCTVQSNCVAIEPVATDSGTKRRINQTACNKDLSCATGFCPAFVEVTGHAFDSKAALDQKDEQIRNQLEVLSRVPAPALQQSKQVINLLLAGVGGTGIVTVSALIGAAAKLDGLKVTTLDMTGLAQKGGAVFSHIRMGFDTPVTARIPNGQVDVVVGCDLVSCASSEALALMSSKTNVVVNNHVSPTAEFVLQGKQNPLIDQRLARLENLAGEVRHLPADKVVENVLGGVQQSNVFLLGFAYQQGGIPLSLRAMEEAISINGVDVDKNLLAFHLGRKCSVDKGWLEPAGADDGAAEPKSLNDFLASAEQDLTAYANAEYAHKYLSLVGKVMDAERKADPDSDRLSWSVAKSYKKLLMLKDEYEVARLYSDGQFADRLKRNFGATKIKYLLAPPLLGDKKRKFGAGMAWGFKVLAALKFLRNTVADPFRYTAERRQGLALVDEFESLCLTLCENLDLQNLKLAAKMTDLYDEIRGFGHVKAAKLARAQETRARLMQEFLRPSQTVVLFDPGAHPEKAA